MAKLSKFAVQHTRNNRYDVYPQDEPMRVNEVDAYSAEDATDRVANIPGMQSIIVMRVWALEVAVESLPGWEASAPWVKNMKGCTAKLMFSAYAGAYGYDIYRDGKIVGCTFSDGKLYEGELSIAWIVDRSLLDCIKNGYLAWNISVNVDRSNRGSYVSTDMPYNSTEEGALFSETEKAL